METAHKINVPDIFYENAIEIEEINEKLLTLRTIDPPGIVRCAALYWCWLTACISLLYIGAGSLAGSLRPSRCFILVLAHWLAHCVHLAALYWCWLTVGGCLRPATASQWLIVGGCLHSTLRLLHMALQWLHMGAGSHSGWCCSWEQRIRGTFREDFELNDFPYDVSAKILSPTAADPIDCECYCRCSC